MNIVSLVKSRFNETYALHRRYVNPQFVRVLEVIGYNRNYAMGRGAHLTDEQGREVLDFLAGFGVFNIGRNHPLVAQVLKDVIDMARGQSGTDGCGVIIRAFGRGTGRSGPGESGGGVFHQFGNRRRGMGLSRSPGRPREKARLSIVNGLFTG